MKLLIIDDDPALRQLLAEQIRYQAAETMNPRDELIVREAASAQEGLERVWQAEAVLCDGLDGEWVKVWAVASKRGAHFVLYSGDPAQVNQANLIGVRAFSKPFGTQEAIAALLDSPAARAA